MYNSKLCTSSDYKDVFSSYTSRSEAMLLLDMGIMCPSLQARFIRGVQEISEPVSVNFL